jgi:hypothetical protein
LKPETGLWQWAVAGGLLVQGGRQQQEINAV